MIRSRDLEDRQGPGDFAEPKDGRPGAPSTRLPSGADTPRRNNETEARQALTERIAKAKVLEPEGADRHCVDCWTRGRNAAIRIIEGADQ